jgi:hypothetical protein
MKKRSSSSRTSAARTYFCNSITLPKCLYLKPSSSNSYGQPFFFDSPILRMSNRNVTHKRSVSGAHDQKIYMAGLQTLETPVQRLVRRGSVRIRREPEGRALPPVSKVALEI